MNLQDLNNTIQSYLRTSKIIKNNLSNDLLIVEPNNFTSTGKLKSVKLKNTPTNNCWLFEHEDAEEQLKASGSKVEKTILYLNDADKELLLISVEMKSGFKIDELLSCEKKLNCSLSHLSIFLATNNHMLEQYENYKIKFRLVIYCNNEYIDKSNPLIVNSLCQSFLDYRNGKTNKFKVEINSPTLGYKIIPAICIHKNAQENIIMDFNDLLTEIR